MIDNLLKDALKEIAILKKLNHKNVIKLFEIIHHDDESLIYLILECVSNGCILEYNQDENTFSINKAYTINNPDKTDYTEEEIKDFIRDIVLGLDYCKFIFNF